MMRFIVVFLAALLITAVFVHFVPQASNVLGHIPTYHNAKQNIAIGGWSVTGTMLFLIAATWGCWRLAR